MMYPHTLCISTLFRTSTILMVTCIKVHLLRLGFILDYTIMTSSRQTRAIGWRTLHGLYIIRAMHVKCHFLMDVSLLYIKNYFVFGDNNFPSVGRGVIS